MQWRTPLIPAPRQAQVRRLHSRQHIKTPPFKGLKIYKKEIQKFFVTTDYDPYINYMELMEDSFKLPL